MADIKKNGTLVSTAKKNNVNFCFTERVQTGTTIVRKAGTIAGMDRGGIIDWDIYPGDYATSLEYEVKYSSSTIRTGSIWVSPGNDPRRISGGRGYYLLIGVPGKEKAHSGLTSDINPEYGPVYGNVRRARLIKTAA